jgi:hypothetical protein
MSKSPKTTMSADDFRAWALAMVEKGIVQREADLPALLGISRQGFWLMKKRGADCRTDLACGALIMKRKPWSKTASTGTVTTST